MRSINADMSKPNSPLFVPEGQHDRICIAAPGPSLTEQQFQMVKAAGLFTIAIGTAFYRCPNPDILYHCDHRWWNHYKGLPEHQSTHKVSFEDTKLQNVHHLLRSPIRDCIDLTPSTISVGNNSGYQAINLACHYRPKEIILIGYDLKYCQAKKAYNCSPTGDHPREIKGMNCFLDFIHTITLSKKHLDNLGVTVYNCTIDTNLKCFERRELKDALRL